LFPRRLQLPVLVSQICPFPSVSHLEANAKNLHQTGRAFIMREVLLYISEYATNLSHLVGARRNWQLIDSPGCPKDLV
jgi:hypothetical protein